MSAVSKWLTPASSAASTTAWTRPRRSACRSCCSRGRRPTPRGCPPCASPSPSPRVASTVGRGPRYRRRSIGSLGPVDEVGEAYRGVRLRVSTSSPMPTSRRSTPLRPATPEWTVHDVLAHLVGVAADIVSGNLDGVGYRSRGRPRRSTARRERTCVRAARGVGRARSGGRRDGRAVRSGRRPTPVRRDDPRARRARRARRRRRTRLRCGRC